jgi:hypothetical protein
MRELCTYFETKCKEVEAPNNNKNNNKLTGHLTYHFSNNRTSAYNDICDIINFHKDKFEITDLFGFICDAFVQFNKCDVLAAKIHENKDNYPIFHLLDRLVQLRLVPFGSPTFDDSVLDQLRVLHSKLLSPFIGASLYTNGSFSNTSNNTNNETSIHSQNNANNDHLEIHDNGNDVSYDEKMRKIDNFLRDRENKELVFLFNKQIRFRNHLAIAQIHFDNGTAPSSLFYNRFPRPLFPTNSNFIDKYNIIINNFQKETLKLITSTLENELTQINDKINIFKDKFESKFTNSSFKFEEIVRQGLKNEEKCLEPTILKNKYRAERAEVRILRVRVCHRDNGTPETSINLSHDGSNSNYSNSQNGSRSNSIRRMNVSRDHRDFSNRSHRSNPSRPQSNHSRPRSNSRDFRHDGYNRNRGNFENHNDRRNYNYRDRSRPSHQDQRHDFGYNNRNNGPRNGNNYNYNDRQHSRYNNNNNNNNRGNGNNSNYNNNNNNNNNAPQRRLNRELRFSDQHY